MGYSGCVPYTYGFYLAGWLSPPPGTIPASGSTALSPYSIEASLPRPLPVFPSPTLTTPLDEVY